MPSARIQRSSYYARQIRLSATTGTWAVPSPQAAPSTGDRVAAGQLVGTSTGNFVRLPTQPVGVFFLEVSRPGRANAWVLNTATRPAGAAGPVPLARAATAVRAAVAKGAAVKQLLSQSIAPKRPAAKAQARPAATGDGAAVLRNIVANDQQTHAHLVQAYYHRAVATRAGVADNPQLAAQLATVTASYEARQDKVRKSRFVRVTSGMGKSAQGWRDKLATFFGVSGIGVLPALPAIPVLLWVALGAGAVGALWLLLHKDEPKSVADVQKSFQLSEAYGTMNPEQQQASNTAIEEAARGGMKEGEDNEKNSLINVIKNNVLLIGGALLLMNYAGKPRR